jgi:hypothetical protein
MEVVYPGCAGLDVHKDSVVACARVAVGGKGDAGREVVRHDHQRAARAIGVA